jgi:hypothetical protein
MQRSVLRRNLFMFIQIHAVLFNTMKVSDNASHELKQLAQCRMAVKCCV